MLPIELSGEVYPPGSGVVHLARRRGLVTPSGPPAALVPQDDRVADPGRDGLGVPDVQRQAGSAQARAELPAAQEARQPARAGQQVHGLLDDGLLQRSLAPVGGTGEVGGVGPASAGRALGVGPVRPVRWIRQHLEQLAGVA